MVAAHTWFMNIEFRYIMKFDTGSFCVMLSISFLKLMWEALSADDS